MQTLTVSEKSFSSSFCSILRIANTEPFITLVKRSALCSVLPYLLYNLLYNYEINYLFLFALFHLKIYTFLIPLHILCGKVLSYSRVFALYLSKNGTLHLRFKIKCFITKMFHKHNSYSLLYVKLVSFDN